METVVVLYYFVCAFIGFFSSRVIALSLNDEHPWITLFFSVPITVITIMWLHLTVMEGYV
jgi:hypothetical protein